DLFGATVESDGACPRLRRQSAVDTPDLLITRRLVHILANGSARLGLSDGHFGAMVLDDVARSQPPNHPGPEPRVCLLECPPVLHQFCGNPMVFVADLLRGIVGSYLAVVLRVLTVFPWV